MARTVSVAVPATSANLGPGFDSLGLALNLTCTVTLSLDEPAAPLSVGAAERMALAAAAAVYEAAHQRTPIELHARYEGEIPVGRGLGASAAVRVAAQVAANRLLDDHFTPDQLLDLAARSEGHADNAAPALFGGFQVVVYEQGRVSRVAATYPDQLAAVVLVPDFEMPTEESRKLLPESLSRADVVHNIGRASLLVAAMATGNLAALRVATRDVLHQPARSKLFPALFDIIDAAEAAGAACAYLSGGGSSVLALTAGEQERVGAAMLDVATRRDVRARIINTTISQQGAQVTQDTAA